MCKCVKSFSVCFFLYHHDTRDPDQLQTTSNEAYNVVEGTGRRPEDEYEVQQDLPPSTSSSSSQPTTTAPAGDYEPV